MAIVAMHLLINNITSIINMSFPQGMDMGMENIGADIMTIATMTVVVVVGTYNIIITMFRLLCAT
jgi:hypothetical protein